MPTPLEEARAQVVKLELEQKLIDALEKANERHEVNPTDKNYAEHNRAQEALADYRAEVFAGGTTIGGDAVKSGE